MTDAAVPWEAILANVLSLIQIASWPAIAIITILMFRSQIGQILTSIATRPTKITLPGGWALDLAEAQTFVDRFAPEIAELHEIQRQSPTALIGGEATAPGTVDEEPPSDFEGVVTENVDEEESPTPGEEEGSESVDE